MYYVLVDGESGQEYRPVQEDLVPASQVEGLKQELQRALEGYAELARATVPPALADLIAGQSLEEIKLSAERVRQAYRALQRQAQPFNPYSRQAPDMSPIARIAAGLRGTFGTR